MFNLRDKVAYKGLENSMVGRVWRISEDSIGIVLLNGRYLFFSHEEAAEKLEKVGVFNV